LSLRTRLTLVLAIMMLTPLLATWLAVGLVVPHTADRLTLASVERSVGSTETVLATQCAGIADAARALAADLRTQLASGEEITAGASGNAAIAIAADQPGVTVAVLFANHIIAVAGPRGDSLTAETARQAATSSCSARSVGQLTSPMLAESVAVTVSGTELARAVAFRPLDDLALSSLVDGLGLSSTIMVLDEGADLLAASNRSVAGPGDLAVLTRDVAAGRTDGRAGRLRFHAVAGPVGLPYTVVAVEPVAGGGLLGWTGIAVVITVAASVLLVRVLAGRLTGPLLRVTETAERFGSGDLTARTGVRVGDEVGRLAVAFDTMAEGLAAKVAELEASRDALSDTFERFGEALGRTHDIDGLLYTVVEAAMRGADAVVGTALLGDDRSLEERATAVRDGGPSAVIDALDDLHRLATDAVRRGEPATVDELPSAGAAIAVLLERDGRVIGALAVAREIGSGPLDRTSARAVQALATHAGTAVANVRAHEETRRQSMTDPLTGVGNFRQLTIVLGREVERALRFHRPLSVLMLDLDHFKRVNDSRGHAFGDAVLREFAARLHGCLREVDMVARYGGEEFAVILPETGAEGAAIVADRVLSAIRDEPFFALGQRLRITVSIGAASFPDHGNSAAEVMRSADAALYAAKRGGRDRWRLAGSAGDPQPLTAAR
jgi:two-component system, cell cycle response regulator